MTFDSNWDEKLYQRGSTLTEAIMTFKVLHGNFPSHIKEFFTMSTVNTTYNRRNRHNCLWFPIPRSEKNFQYAKTNVE